MTSVQINSDDPNKPIRRNLVRRLYDSALEQRCCWCQKPIPAGENQVVYGTGNSTQYLRAYHLECEEQRVQLLDAIDRSFKAQLENLNPPTAVAAWDGT
jgi:hypothetical protein